MTEQTPTPEQIAAVDWLLGSALGGYTGREAAHAQLLLSSLPAELTNPRPALPTEPGAYHDARGTLTIIDPRGKWHGTYGDVINPDICPGPFTRLVPERSQVTVEEIQSAITDIVRSRSFSAARLLSDIHVQDLAAKLHAALVNGDPR